MASKNKITPELQATVRSNPRIDNVYFDESGRHYFYVHELISSPNDKGGNKEKYGQGTFAYKQLIPGEANIDGLKEDIAHGVASSKIVETISREDVLNADVTSDSKSTNGGNSESILQQFAKLSAEDRAAFVSLINSATSATEAAKEPTPLPPPPAATKAK